MAPHAGAGRAGQRLAARRGIRVVSPRAVLAQAILGLGVVRGAVFEGWLPESSDYAEYVGKFCYDHDNNTGKDKFVGEVRLTTFREGAVGTDTAGTDRGELYFLLFTDETHRWRPAWEKWETTDCREKIKEATYWKKIDYEEEKSEQIINIWLHARPRFIYFSFIGCGLSLGEPMRYRVHTENGLWGWQREFSFDKMGLCAVYGIFIGLFAILLIGAFRIARARDVAEHPYLQLLLLANMASVGSCGLLLGHSLLFMRDGIGSKRMEFLASLATVVANCTIFLIAILSATGWAITDMKLHRRRCFLGFVMVVGGLSMLCELRAETTVSQSTKLYSYQSTPGMLALLLKIFMFCWFAYQAQATHDAETNHNFRRFYKYLGGVVSFWSLTPIITALLAFYVVPWHRYKVVTIADIIARFTGQALLSWLFCGTLSPITMDNTFPGGRLDSDHISLTAFGQI